VRILVLSRKPSSYSTRRLREAARVEGHQCLCVDPLRCVLRVESGASRVQVGGQDVRADVVLPRVGAFAADYAIAVAQQFELSGVPVVNRGAAIATAKNKFACLQALAAAGLPVPPTAMMRYSTHLESTLEAFGGPPAILKLLRGMQGAGVMLAESREAAESSMDTVWALGHDVLVQKFIRECRGRDLRVLTVGGEVVAAMRRVAREGDFRSNIHRGGAGIRTDVAPAVADLALRAARAVGLDIAGVDILEADSGSLVLEVNSSPGFQGLEDATDRDIGREMIRFAASLAARRAGVPAGR
jgi:ribosomal protein S6--L-glutamate ligase